MEWHGDLAWAEPSGALALGLASWALGGSPLNRRAALTALLLFAAVAVVRLCFPEPFCAVRWPSPLAGFCSQ